MPVRVPVKVRHEGGGAPGVDSRSEFIGHLSLFRVGMKAGSKLELVIMLPPGLGLGLEGGRSAKASVVRVEESEARGWRLAATIDRIDLLPEIS